MNIVLLAVALSQVSAPPHPPSPPSIVVDVSASDFDNGSWRVPRVADNAIAWHHATPSIHAERRAIYSTRLSGSGQQVVIHWDGVSFYVRSAPIGALVAVR